MKLKFISTHIIENDKPGRMVSLSVDHGENLNIIGPSGSGKTNYVNALFGLPNIVKGNIIINGEDTNQISLEKWTVIRRMKISCVFQNLEIFEELSIEDNIKLATNLHNKIDHSNTNYLIDSLGLMKYKSIKAKTLSLGEKQRLAICRALARPFSLIVLDEPFSHLDVENIEIATTLINKISNDNKANIILTSHSKADVLTFHKEMFV